MLLVGLLQEDLLAVDQSLVGHCVRSSADYPRSLFPQRAIRVLQLLKDIPCSPGPVEGRAGGKDYTSRRLECGYIIDNSDGGAKVIDDRYGVVLDNTIWSSYFLVSFAKGQNTKS